MAVASGIIARLASGGLANFHIDSTPKASFAYEMMKTDQAISFLDINKAKENKTLLEFLSKKIHVNSIGATYSGRSHNINPNNQVILKDTFDGMIFIKSTTGAKRPRLGSELPDGNKFIVISFILNLIVVIAGLTGIILITIKVGKKSKLKGEGKYYLLSKDSEDSVRKKSLKGLIVKVNDYFNSISTTKYCIFLVLTITILNLIYSRINFFDTYKIINYNSKIIILRSLLFSTIAGLVQIYLTFILPLTIVKEIADSKYTNLSYIIIAAIIGAIISILGHSNSGIGLYSFNIFANFIQGVIYSYSYDLFHYREEKPIINFMIIL